jgi:hypothetical protein
MTGEDEQSNKRKIESKVEKIKLDELRQIVHSLDKLLEHPEPGLMTWQVMVQENLLELRGLCGWGREKL